jgi:hypothetical protein
VTRLFALLAAVVGLVVLAFVAFGSSTNRSLDPVAQAATASAQTPGFRMRMTLQLSSPALPAMITGHGAGRFDLRDHSGSMRVTIADLPQVGSLSMREIVSGQTIYIQLPPNLTAAMPGLGKPWLSVDLSKLSGFPGLSSLESNPGTEDPSQMLEYLRAVSDSVASEGHARVGHIETTHYRAQLDLDRVAGALPSDQQSAAAKAITALEQQTNLHSFPVDVWVDAHHLVRRMRITVAASLPSGQSLDETATFDFTHYGPQPEPALPPASDVENLNGLLASAG